MYYIIKYILQEVANLKEIVAFPKKKQIFTISSTVSRQNCLIAQLFYFLLTKRSNATNLTTLFNSVAIAKLFFF